MHMLMNSNTHMYALTWKHAHNIHTHAIKTTTLNKNEHMELLICFSTVFKFHKNKYFIRLCILKFDFLYVFFYSSCLRKVKTPTNEAFTVEPNLEVDVSPFHEKFQGRFWVSFWKLILTINEEKNNRQNKAIEKQNIPKVTCNRTGDKVITMRI